MLFIIYDIIHLLLHASEDRIRNGAKKLEKHKGGSTQGRLDSFFKSVPSPSAAMKRKVILGWVILGCSVF